MVAYDHFPERWNSVVVGRSTMTEGRLLLVGTHTAVEDAVFMCVCVCVCVLDNTYYYFVFHFDGILLPDVRYYCRDCTHICICAATMYYGQVLQGLVADDLDI